MNFFLGRIKGGSLSLGEDPELEPGRQVLKEAKFMSRQELDEIQTLYPEYLKDEFWRFLREDYLGYNAFKIRNN